MDFYKIIFIIYFFCLNSVVNIYIDNESDEEIITNIFVGNIFWVTSDFDNRNIEIRFFFQKKILVIILIHLQLYMKKKAHLIQINIWEY